MGGFKAWLLGRFLPAWAKETVYRENQDLRAKIDRLRAEIDCLNAYAAGLEKGLRVKRRVNVEREVVQ